MERLGTCIGSALWLIAATTACGGGGGGDSGGRAAATTTAAASTASASSGQSSGSSSGGTGMNGAANQQAFEQTVYPIVRSYCAGCHQGGGEGFPDIAHPDAGSAYRATVDNQKINLNNPASSRLVLRMFPDRHHCWSASCNADAAAMQAAITQWAQLVMAQGSGSSGSTGGTGTQGGGNSTVISSFSNTLANAVQAASGRTQPNVIALYDFEEGAGETAYDTSGVTPPMNLSMQGVNWVPGGGIETVGGRAAATRADSMKLYNKIASGSGTQQYSIEAWLIPANVTQEGPARIMTYSSGTGARNFTMGQVLYNYDFRSRSLSTGIGTNGTPSLRTADADEDLQATLQHAVMTYDPTNGRRIYVNGQFTGDVDGFSGGLLTNWDSTHIFSLGAEQNNARAWRGQLKFVAIHNMALTQQQVLQNYLAGSGRKFILRFGLDEWLAAGSYIEFEVSDFDAFSYLFCFPTLSTSTPNGFPVEKIRIAVNGVAPVASQSFRNVEASVDEPRERLSSQCSVVPKELGNSADSFAIWFEQLANNERRVVETPPAAVPDDSVAEALPNTAVRAYDQINNSMAALTGVLAQTPAISSAFLELTQQLPADSDIRSFVSSQQVAISKLALEYCDLMVESAQLRTAFFGSQFEFASPVPTAFGSQLKEDLIINALIDRMIGIGLGSQPERADVAVILDSLIGTLTAGCTPQTCDAVRTRTVVKGVCASVLSSAAVQIH